jgi:hypothetical protein
MKSFRTVVAIIAIAIFYSLLPANASADDWNKKMNVTFNQPVEIPGMVLPAGTYVFKRVDSVDPRVFQILSADEKHVYATVLTVPDYRMDPSDTAMVTFEERPKGSPEAIKSWFYPGDTIGEELVPLPVSCS